MSYDFYDLGLGVIYRFGMQWDIGLGFNDAYLVMYCDG
jgi:hypothetical protein